jgi:hypothetical protein
MWAGSYGTFSATAYSLSMGNYGNPSNIFSIRAFREFVETVFVNEMRLFSVELIAYAKSNTPVDLQDLFFRFTLDSFGQVGFGVLKDNLGMLS